MRALSMVNVFESSIGSNLRWTLFARRSGGCLVEASATLGCVGIVEIDISGNELFCLPSVTESASNAFVLLYFVVFYSIDG